MKKQTPKILLLDKVNPMCRQELEKAGYDIRQEDSLSRKELEEGLKKTIPYYDNLLSEN